MTRRWNNSRQFSSDKLASVFDAVLDKALDLCSAAFGNLWVYNGKTFEVAVKRRVPKAHADAFASAATTLRPGAVLWQLANGSNTAQILDAAAPDGPYGDAIIVKFGHARTIAGVALRKDDASQLYAISSNSCITSRGIVISCCGCVLATQPTSPAAAMSREPGNAVTGRSRQRRGGATRSRSTARRAWRAPLTALGRHGLFGRVCGQRISCWHHRRAPISTKSTSRPPHREQISRLCQSRTGVPAP